MDNLLFEYLGEAIALCFFAYFGSIIAIKHPSKPNPLFGLKKILFVQVLGVSILIIVFEKALIHFTGIESDIWKVCSIIVAVGVGRYLAHRLIRAT